MITRSSIAFEDFLGSSIVPQVMPPCSRLTKLQVLRLYQLYKMDHEMFDYSPETYIAFAK